MDDLVNMLGSMGTNDRETILGQFKVRQALADRWCAACLVCRASDAADCVCV
jgi:hypothetical protein